MKRFRLYILKSYLRLGLFFYFKSVKVTGLNNIPENKPVLLLSNHQNALLDALLIATSIKGYAHYLARAGVFKKTFVSKLLRSFQLIPVFRIRDGYSNLTNNNEIFDKASNLLNANETVTIFPEGSHNLARRVRPLSKGFTRIIFNVLDKNPDGDLQLVPIGVNFTNAKACPDSAAIYFGKPIAAKHYLKDDKHQAIVNLKEGIHNGIAKLTTHIPKENYDDTLSRLESLNVDFLNPKAVNSCITNDFKNCKSKPKSKLNWLQQGLKYLLILNLLLPYLVWKFVAQPKIKEIEFTSTFRFAIAVTLVPIYLLLVGVTLTVVFGFKVALTYVVGVLLLALVTIKI